MDWILAIVLWFQLNAGAFLPLGDPIAPPGPPEVSCPISSCPQQVAP